MILTTSDKIPGKEIERTLGLVRGNTIRAKHIGKDILAGLRSIVGGEIKEYTEALDEARKSALERMVAEAEKLGAGEICLNSIDADGVQQGYELELAPLISENVNIPVIASGGAGNIDHIYDVLTKGRADAALVASIVHYGTYTIRQIKEELHARDLKVRVAW